MVSMRIRMTLVAALAAACSSAPAWAQSGEKGQVELGIYGLVTNYDNDAVALESKFGAGGLLQPISALVLHRFPLL